MIGKLDRKGRITVATYHEEFSALITGGIRLARDFPALAPRRASLAVSLNRRYADTDAALKDGDELVFIPPVSGG